MNKVIATVTSPHGEMEVLKDGKAYAVTREPIKQMITPGWEDFYRLGGSERDLANGGGVWVPVRTQFRDEFQGAQTIKDLMDPWTGFIAQSPLAPTVAEYVALRTNILKHGGDFLDNRIEPIMTPAGTVLKCTAAEPDAGQISKASIESRAFNIRDGAHVVIEAKAFLKDAYPTTIIDLESTFIDESMGIRLCLTGDGTPYVELKWGAKPKLHAETPLPLNTPIDIEWVMNMDAERGWVQVKFNGITRIDGIIQTLPITGIPLDVLEVGVTATHKACIVFFANVSLGVTNE